MPLEQAFVGGRHTGLKLNLLRNDGTPFDLTGASVSARIANLAPGGATVNSDGTFTLLAGNALTITGLVNTLPITLTVANHGLVSGTAVKVANVTGCTNANGLWLINVLDSNNFQLVGSIGNGAWAGGGTVTANINQVQWAYGAQDVGTAGFYEVQFKADYGANQEYSQIETWQVAAVL